MDVTVNITEDVGQKARQKATVEGFTSLRGWISHLVAREVQEHSQANSKTLLEALADPETADRDVEFLRDQDPVSGTSFD